MDLVYHLPETSPPSSIKEVVASLNGQKLNARHDKQDWGDWIHLEARQTVISIESMRGLTRSATIELSESDPESLLPKITSAFTKLGWYGSDEDGEYKL